MRSVPLRPRKATILSLALAIPGLACAQQPPARVEEANRRDGDLAAEVARVRAATEAFKSLDAAVAAGYAADVRVCVDNPPEGGMGYHHQNHELLDDTIELGRPEMLLYERLPDDSYRLNGVEYIVPFSARPPSAEPPTVMGQPLKSSPSLGLWYRHVWVWLENPSGLFADWHPGVECRASGPG